MISKRFYRLWLEAHDRGFQITPAHGKRDRAGNLPDFVWDVHDPTNPNVAQVVTADLEGWLAKRLAVLQSAERLAVLQKWEKHIAAHGFDSDAELSKITEEGTPS